MKIVVISGSPKGKHSISLQSVLYIEKHHPEVEFEIFHVGQRIKTFTKDKERFDQIIAAVEVCDCVLWCYPVYTFLVPYQLVKFIDLIFERDAQVAFVGKYASQISTSKHFYDHTAYNYIHNVSEDLGMRHLPGHCADMDDLTLEPGRERLRTFAEELVSSVRDGAPVSRKYIPVAPVVREYVSPQVDVVAQKGNDHSIVLVTDCTDDDVNLRRMIDTYCGLLPNEVQVMNLNDFDFQGGCLGCFHCAFEGNCIYHDGFDDFHRRTVLEADCVILAATVHHHWFRPIWKCYDDRQFYNGHRTSTMGKSVGYIISGPLRQESNLREVLEARSEVAGQFLLDIVTDEYDSDAEITSLLVNLAEKTMWAAETRPQRPASFRGVGGMKVFRDLVYVMRGLMQEDHRFYKEHGLYDFPQQQRRRALQMKLFGLLLKHGKTRKNLGVYMRDGMLKQYTEIIKEY